MPAGKLWERALLLPLLRAFNTLAGDTASRLGGGLGVLVWRCGLRRRLVNEQLTACLGLRGPARARVARRSYASMGANFIEILAVGGPDGPERHIRHLNPAWCRRILRGRPGPVFVTGHMGAWDLAAMAIGRITGRVLVYAKQQHAAFLDTWVNRQRQRDGVEVLLAHRGDRTAALRALRALREGTPIGLMADQRPGGDESEAACFLGRPAHCHAGPAFFARKAGALLVAGACFRVRAGRFVFLAGRPFPAGDDRPAAVQRGMDQLSALIAARPGQYFWQHHRFKGEAPPPIPSSETWRAGIALLGRP